MIAFPRCKINIGIHILEKRTDGYHNIETLFYPIGLSDGLEIIKTDGKTVLTLSGLPIEENGKPNLCIMAYELLKDKFDLPPVKIHLHKKIPSGSGLGGGSSDAANTLLLLNSMFNLDIDKNELAQYASRLGADCAFFIYNKPIIGKNIGYDFIDTDVDLSGFYVAVIKPNIHINTKKAYEKVTPDSNRSPLKELIEKPMEKWKNEVVNDFEKYVFKEYPNVESIKTTLYKKGALFASMTGSGPAIFGIFDHDPVQLNKIFGKHIIWKEKITM